MKQAVLATLSVLLIMAASGCKTLDALSEAGAKVAVATGTVTPGQADSIKRTSSAVAKSFEDITPEQEYYIGRAVGATILKTYKPYANDAATRYLNVLGQTLAMASDKPETFGGYHFLILDTDEINAFAAPGGLVFISRGLLRCCTSEDAVAAVLAHEVGHVQSAHGLRAIKKSRLTSALTILAAESAKNLGGADLAKLTQAFEGTIGDITSTLVNSGYARRLETEADGIAVDIMERVGYDPHALKDMLIQMQRRMANDQRGFAKTHPDPSVRINDIERRIQGPATASPGVRQARFEAALGGI